MPNIWVNRWDGQIADGGTTPGANRLIHIFNKSTKRFVREVIPNEDGTFASDFASPIPEDTYFAVCYDTTGAKQADVLDNIFTVYKEVWVDNAETINVNFLTPDEDGNIADVVSDALLHASISGARYNLDTTNTVIQTFASNTPSNSQYGLRISPALANKIPASGTWTAPAFRSNIASYGSATGTYGETCLELTTGTSGSSYVSFNFSSALTDGKSRQVYKVRFMNSAAQTIQFGAYNGVEYVYGPTLTRSTGAMSGGSVSATAIGFSRSLGNDEFLVVVAGAWNGYAIARPLFYFTDNSAQYRITPMGAFIDGTSGFDRLQYANWPAYVTPATSVVSEQTGDSVTTGHTFYLSETASTFASSLGSTGEGQMELEFRLSRDYQMVVSGSSYDNILSLDNTVFVAVSQGITVGGATTSAVAFAPHDLIKIKAVWGIPPDDIATAHGWTLGARRVQIFIYLNGTYTTTASAAYSGFATSPSYLKFGKGVFGMDSVYIKSLVCWQFGLDWV